MNRITKIMSPSREENSRRVSMIGGTLPKSNMASLLSTKTLSRKAAAMVREDKIFAAR
jgi:hypothetical protein